MPADRIEPTEAEIAAVHAALTGPAPAYDGPTNSLDRINLLARHVAKAMLSASPARGEGDAPVAWIAPLELARMTDAFEETAWLNVVLFAENDQARVALYTRPDPEVPAPTALRLAISHIEHMAAWIAADNRGYSFEALGEDMATIKAGLTATPEGLREAVRKVGRWVQNGMEDQSGDTPSREALRRDLTTILAALQPQAEGE